MHRLLPIILALTCVFSVSVRAQVTTPALFRVRSASGVVSYLFGSFHYGIGLDELPSSTIAAFTQAQAHVYELSAYREWDLLLRVKHEPNLMAELLRLAGKDEHAPGEFNPREIDHLVRLGIPRHVAIRMRDDQCPLFTLRSMFFGESPARSLDAELQKETVRLGRRLIELEDEQIREQARRDATARGYTETCSVRELLNDPTKRLASDAALREAVKQYHTMGPREVLALADDDDPDVWFRNRVWMSTLTPLLHSTPSFVVVGLFHLNGPHGLIALLRESGFTVEPEEALR